MLTGNFAVTNQLLAVIGVLVERYKNLDEIQGLSKNSLSSVKVPKGWKVTLFDQVDFKGNRKVLTQNSALLSDFN